MSLIPGLDTQRKLDEAHADMKAVRDILERHQALLERQVELLEQLVGKVQEKQ